MKKLLILMPIIPTFPKLVLLNWSELQTDYKKKTLIFIGNEDSSAAGKGRTKEQKWEKCYTPKLKKRIYQKERVLF